MPQGKPRRVVGSVGPADRGPRRLGGGFAALAGTLILAGLGVWFWRRSRSRGPAAARSHGHAPSRAQAAPPAEARGKSPEYARAPGDASAHVAEGASRGRRSRAKRLARWAPAVVGVVLVLALGGWLLVERGDVLVMQTPSMGTTAPAGSLVLTRPIAAAPLHVGMIVAFHVPVTGQVYMHRVAQLLPGGRFRTRGDLNTSDDGWELTRRAIVGVPALIVPDLGWLVMGLPWALAVLAIGAIVSFALPRFLVPAMRSVTVGVAVALPLYIIRPFVRVAVASAGRVASAARSAGARSAGALDHGGVTMAASSAPGASFRARLVNGGVLPLRVTLRGTHTVIEPGHAGVIAATLARRTASTLEAHPVLPVWAWIVLGAVVLAPIPAGLLALRDRLTTTTAPAGLNRGREAADKGG